jgi:hypothetical protein
MGLKNIGKQLKNELIYATDADFTWSEKEQKHSLLFYIFIRANKLKQVFRKTYFKLFIYIFRKCF